MTDTARKIVSKECRFAIHIPERHGTSPDLHLVKEQINYSDGTSEPNLKWIKEFPRVLAVHHPRFRKYEQKREWAALDELIIKNVTQSNLAYEAAMLLHGRPLKLPIKQLAKSPYLYGTDITSTSLLKKKYMDHYPDANTPFTLATYDVETDVLFGTGEIILSTVVFKKDVFITAKRSFIEGIANLEEYLQEKARKYIGEYLDKYEMKIHLDIGETVVDVIRLSFGHVHRLKPDWLAIWNMDFDIPKVIENLERHGEDPRDYLCDPSIPKALRICNYRQGPKKKTTASGRVIPINPAAQWHTLINTASFYVIDAMCAYKHLRMSEQEESSYGLDAILTLKLGIRKLKFKEADAYSDLRWHQFMQQNYKVEYMVYNIFDCVSMVELDNTTKDLQYTLPKFAATTDFNNFKSQPRRIADALHFFALEQGYMMGTVAMEDKVEAKEEIEDSDGTEPDDEEENEEQEEGKVLDRKGWVLTLPPHNSVLGLPLILEDATMRTGIRAFVFDSDATAAYPSATSVGNVSKTTTKRELISIEGIEEHTARMNNINLVLGPVNAIEYSVEMFSLPQPDRLLELLD